MQSLSRQGEVDPLVERYGHVIVDECHHVGAVSFDAILKRTKAKYVLGLTATPPHQFVVTVSNRSSSCNVDRFGTRQQNLQVPRMTWRWRRIRCMRVSPYRSKQEFRMCSGTSPTIRAERPQ